MGLYQALCASDGLRLESQSLGPLRRQHRDAGRRALELRASSFHKCVCIPDRGIGFGSLRDRYTWREEPDARSRPTTRSGDPRPKRPAAFALCQLDQQTVRSLAQAQGQDETVEGSHGPALLDGGEQLAVEPDFEWARSRHAQLVHPGGSDVQDGGRVCCRPRAGGHQRVQVVVAPSCLWEVCAPPDLDDGAGVASGDVHALFRGIQATLAQRLQERGWRTGAVVSNYVLRRGTGIELGFERYDDDLPDTELNRDQPERVAADTTTAALSLLDDLLEAPAAGVFLWVHYQDPHGPYLPPDGLRERHLEAARDGADGRRELPVHGLNPVGAIPRYQAVGDEREIAFYRAGYAGEVEATDQEIGRLLAGVAERAPESPTTVLFTADHGESLGEDDYWFAHGRFLSDALVRVPLMIRTPGVEASVREDIVSLVDVMPTLLALAGDGEISSTSGRNLLADDSAHVAGQAYLANLMGAAKKRWGWVADGHVLIQEQDGSEVSLRSLRTGAPVADPARQAQMGDKLDAFRAALRVQPEVQQRLSPQDVEMLRQLGYFE